MARNRYSPTMAETEGTLSVLRALLSVKVNLTASSKPLRHLRGSGGISPLTLNLVTRRECVVKLTPWPLYRRERAPVPVTSFSTK
jgi:hypothetical protein